MAIVCIYLYLSPRCCIVYSPVNCELLSDMLCVQCVCDAIILIEIMKNYGLSFSLKINHYEKET